MPRTLQIPVFALLGLLISLVDATAAADRVVVSRDGRSFVLDPSGRPFLPWGFNYDHDETGRLIEDYWDEEWTKIESDFHEMKVLGANVVRIHLQLGRFMETPETPRKTSLARLSALLTLAAREELYLDLTGLGCYHKADVPAWYDGLSERDRWAVQARFWKAVAGTCAGNPIVFCYDLMNEPVVPGGKRKDRDWLGGAFAGKHFVQFLTLDQAGRPRDEIARAWVETLRAAIREVDPKTMITVGQVDWSLDRPGLTSGTPPKTIGPLLDFISVHLYPEAKRLEENMKTLAGFSVGKPIIIEETFPLKCSGEEFKAFLNASKTHATGWIGFYWGKTREDYATGKTIPDALMRGYLDIFVDPEIRPRAVSNVN